MKRIQLLSAFSALLFSSHTLAEETTDVSTDKESSFKTIAIPFYDPSVGAGASLVPLYSFYSSDEETSPSTLSATLTYTESQSYSVRGNTDILLDRFRIVTDFGYNYSNIDVQLLEQLKTVATTQKEINFFGDVYYSLTDDLYIGLGINFTANSYIGETNRDRLLLGVSGFTEDYQTDIGLKLSVLFDKREHYYYPYSGYMFEATYEDHAKWLGNDGDKTYSLMTTDYRHYRSLVDENNHILATRWLNRYLFDADNAPASALSTYGRQGRDVQRGFIVGDYVPAANLTSLEMEYRYTPLNTGNERLDRLTYVALGGIGKSFGRQALGPEKSFSESDTLSMVGVGLRYRVMRKERINVRMDVTYNNDGDWLAYFSLGENI
ncbi:BamA/TamA family outer membrane protein [Vibrio sp. RE86]|uniref:BamA/TamA family outer membrane protein n=1 Tax=Vibrio sp. RE86 TaxID=2607605 RepID=UPI001493706D|nr:BamA/TamA family outer membrane protein [Vibrio sp. RE86]